MTTPDPDRDGTALGELLELATDRVHAPSYAAPALARARRRRARRAASGAALAVVLVAVGSLSLVGLAGGTPDGAPARPPTSRPSTVTTPPAPSRSPAPARLDPSIVQPRWDPRGAAELPPSPNGVADALPEVATAPASSPALAEDPVGIAVAVVPDLEGDSAQLLGTSGEWRSVELLGRNSQVALSPGGRCLVVRSVDGGGDEVIAVDDLATGARRTVPAPAGYRGQDFSRVRWLDDERFLLDDAGGGLVVDASTGSSSAVPYPRQLEWAVDPAGGVVEVTGPGRAPVVTDWVGGRRHVVAPATGVLAGIEVSADQVVGTALHLTPDDRVGDYRTAGYAVVVADRRTTTPTAALPVLDVEGNYSGGGLGVAGVRDDGTVLLRVRAYGRAGGDRLVAWDPATGSLTLASALLVGERHTQFAQGLLTAEGP